MLYQLIKLLNTNGTINKINSEMSNINEIVYENCRVVNTEIYVIQTTWNITINETIWYKLNRKQ